jgi:hypothetical protein
MQKQCNPYDEKKFEKNLTEAFLKHYKKTTSYRYLCRPDECCNIPAPDFKYTDIRDNGIVYIELTRITVQNLSYEKGVRDTFAPLSAHLRGKIKGSFLLLIDLDDVSKTTKAEREKSLAELEHTIVEASNSMNENDKLALEKGITLVKYANIDSCVYLHIRNLSPLNSEDKSYLVDLFKKKGQKFLQFRKSNTTHLLLILHNQRVYPWNDIGNFIREIQSGLYEDISFPSDMIDEVYDIILDLEWQQDITVSECYPHSKSEGMGSKTQICETQREYTNWCINYFHGD